MLAIFIGDVSLLLGFAVFLLPLLVTELSRPRDALWGTVALLLGLGLITSNDLLSGSSMLVVVSGSLLIGRLGFEVANSRWEQLSKAEKLRLGSMERWSTGMKQFVATLAQLANMFSWAKKIDSSQPTSKNKKKKWIRSDKQQQSMSSEQAGTVSEEKPQKSKVD